jgi:di/tricarboxylate transporter
METGGAEYLAEALVALMGGLPTPVQLSIVLLIVTLVANLVSNNTAGIISLPVAVQVAQELGAPTEPFVLAVVFGANMSFATPLGHQTNLLVLSAGGYRFADFLRAGIPLTLLMWLGLSVMLAVTYDL